MEKLIVYRIVGIKNQGFEVKKAKTTLVRFANSLKNEYLDRKQAEKVCEHLNNRIKSKKTA